MKTLPDQDEAPTGASSVFTIYCHIHRESNRRYIGLTSKSWERRWSQHISKAKASGRKENGVKNHWYSSLLKYGPGAFDHEILQVCHSLEAANVAEKYWIDLYDTSNPLRGFNIARGGSHVPHPVKNPWDRPGYREKVSRNIEHCFTPEARAKQKASLNTPESKAKRSAIARESLASPETQAKRVAMRANPEYGERISQSLKSALNSPEIRQRMSDSAISSCTQEVRTRISEATKKAYLDPEVKEKHRKATKAAQNRPEVKERARSRIASADTRKKLSEASTGFRHTDESKQEMRRLFLERQARILSESGCSTWSEYIKRTIAINKMTPPTQQNI